MKNAMSLKQLIRNVAKDKNIPAQVLLQNYSFERFLYRLTLTDLKDKFIVKGGMLITLLVGLDQRTTMDLDTTIINYPLNEELITKAIKTICDVKVDDGFNFEFSSINSIRDDDIYGGYRISIISTYDSIITPLSIDITCGDIITPNPIKYEYKGILDLNTSFSIMTYNVETILAEKIETILRRGIYNTRPRDFYDVYVLTKTQKYDKDILLKSLSATMNHRNSIDLLSKTEEILNILKDNESLNKSWLKYKNQYPYANDINFNEIIDIINDLLR